MFLHRLLRFLFPRQPLAGLNHGGRIINREQLSGATDEEKTLILAGVARSPSDARFLLAKYGTNKPADVLKRVARRKRQRTFNDRLRQLAQRIDGHDTRDVWGKPSQDHLPVRVQYLYRGKR